MKWEKVKLGDIATCIQPGPFGSQLHNSDYSKEGTPIIMPKDIVGGAIVHSGLLKVSEEHVKRLSRHQVYEGNLMVARKGDVRKCAYITANENGWMTGSDCLKVVLDESKCYPKFIYYQLRSEHIGRWLEKVSIGATMPSLNTGLLSGIEMVLPPIEIQKQITRNKSNCWKKQASGFIKSGLWIYTFRGMKTRKLWMACRRGGEWLVLQIYAIQLVEVHLLPKFKAIMKRVIFCG